MRSLPLSRQVIALALFVEAVFVVAFYATDGYDVARSGEVIRLIATFATVASLFALVRLAFPSRPRTIAVVSFLLFIPFVGLNFARFETSGAFDYGFAYYNVRELMTPLGRHIVGGRVRWFEVVLFFAVPLALAAFVTFRAAPPRPLAPWRRFAFALVAIAVVSATMSRTIPSHESVTSFVASGIRFHAELRRVTSVLQTADYPYVHEFAPSAEARAIAGADAPRPHVILLFLESWSDRYTHATLPSGGPVLPVFSARRREGLAFDHFYGNSIQSSRGRFATLCSLVPMIRAKEFFALAGEPLNCLPAVLARAGYRTLIASASDEPSFENSDGFFKHMGYASTSWLEPGARGSDPEVWGTGLQDDAFYRRFFRRLDDELAANPGQALFATAINVSHHYPFDEYPRHVPRADLPTKYGRNFVASLAQQDAWLATFFDELARRPAFRDAIVVLVGDHSFPADEHGVHFNGIGAREESFRTAFALRWQGHVGPQVVTDRAASQLDVAPTIVDLLQIRHRTHFVGHSLVAPAVEGETIPLIQPYDGVRLVAMRYPFKLVAHESAEQEHLYDVANDPDEEHDLVADPSHAARIESMRATIERIRQNDAVLHAKRAWLPLPSVAER